MVSTNTGFPAQLLWDVCVLSSCFALSAGPARMGDPIPGLQEGKAQLNTIAPCTCLSGQ